MLFKAEIPGMPFKQWIWKEAENKRLLIFSVVVIAIQFAWFKFYYPLPNFMPPDSDSYVEAAYNNSSISMWAVGYSQFLRFVSCFTSSHFALTLIQYLLLEGSLLYLLYTLRYLLLPGRWVFRALIACSVLNPLVPHISNFVSSDALFTALSLVWFTQLLWILYKPTKPLLVWHAFVLLFAFMVRYYALFYPVISISVIVFSYATTKLKLTGSCLVVLLLGAFIGQTTYRYYVTTKTVQYSPFGGWLMAANALYGYAYAKPDVVEAVPAKFQELHTIVNRHMETIRHKHPRPDEEVAIYYVWDGQSPLNTYLRQRYAKDSTTPYFLRWASVAPLYTAYGRYLMLKHPGLFIKHYLWPNFIKYYAPPPKFMGFYNLKEPTVPQLTAKWFGWKDNRVWARNKERAILVTGAFPILSAVINLVFILSFAGFIYLGGFKRCYGLSRRILWWTFLIWVSNMGFSVFTAPIELRYQLFPMFITFNFCLLIVECMVKENIVEERVTKTETILVPELSRYHLKQ